MKDESEKSPSPAGARPAWILIFPLGWALVVFFKYFHYFGLYLPNGPRLFSAAPWPEAEFAGRLLIWGQSLWILFCAAALMGVILAWGSRSRRWLGLGVEDPWMRAALNFGFGILGFDLLWLGTGLAHLWWTPLLAVVLAAAAGVALWDCARAARERSFSFPVFWPRGQWALAGIAFVYLALVWGHGLAPETFYDSMVYHLAVPSDWLLRHQITDNPANFFSNYPYGAELFFLNGLFVQGTETAKCLHAGAFLFCALAAGGWAREIAGPQAGWLTLGMALTLPLLALNASTTQVEGVLSLFTVLFLYALWKAFSGKTTEAGWVWAFGLLAGAGLSVKYTAAVGLLGGLLGLGRGAFQKSKLTAWFWAGAGALLVLGPWLVKNFCFTGNPFFPYLAHWLGENRLSDGGYARLLAEQRAFDIVHGWSWLTLPWRLIMSNPDGYNFAGPLGLALLPALFFKQFKDPVLGFWARSTGFYFAAGLLITHILRFMAPAFIVFYILAGAFFAGAGRGWARTLSWGAALCAFLCFFYLASISVFYYACGGIWWGKQTRADYLQGPGKITPYASMADWVSKNLPPESRLLIVGDARGLYYDRPFLANSVFDTQVLARAAEAQKDAPGIRLALLKLGVTHLAVNGPEGVRVSSDYHHYDLTPEAWARLDDFFKTQTTLIYDRKFQSVYALRPPAAMPNVEPMPILFFTAPGKSFIEDYQRQNWAAADQALDQALALYPACVFWWEQKAVVASRLGKNPESEKLFEKAAGMGDLTPEGYQQWAQNAEAGGWGTKASRILARGRKLYPGQF